MSPHKEMTAAGVLLGCAIEVTAQIGVTETFP